MVQVEKYTKKWEDEAKVSQQLRELKAQNDKLESELNEIKALLKDKRPLDK